MKLWKLILHVIAGTMFLCGTCDAAQEVTLLEKDGLQLVAKLADTFEPAAPAIITEIRNTRPAAFERMPMGPAEGFRLLLYGADGKEIPVEKAWANRNDPRVNDTLLGHPSEKIPAGGKLTSPSLSMAEVFGPRWREGERLEVEWISGVSRLKQPFGWSLVGSIDMRALAKDASLKATSTPDRALTKIEGAKAEEELIRLAMERLKEQNVQMPEGVKPCVDYRGQNDTYVSIVWAWKNDAGKRSVYVGIDRVTGKISDFVKAGSWK